MANPKGRSVTRRSRGRRLPGVPAAALRPRDAVLVAAVLLLVGLGPLADSAAQPGGARGEAWLRAADLRPQAAGTDFTVVRGGQTLGEVLAVTPAINDRMRELTKNRFEADLDVLELKMKNRELDMLVEEASFFKPDKPEPEQKP